MKLKIKKEVQVFLEFIVVVEAQEITRIWFFLFDSKFCAEINHLWNEFFACFSTYNNFIPLGNVFWYLKNKTRFQKNTKKKGNKRACWMAEKKPSTVGIFGQETKKKHHQTLFIRPWFSSSGKFFLKDFLSKKPFFA